MQLKEEFRTYEALRREHDSQIVQIAMEAGLRIAPDQWSSLLYGDQSHKSHMQSIIDKVEPFVLSFFFFFVLSFVEAFCLFFDLLGRQNDREKDTLRLLVHSPDACGGQSWAKLNAAARNFIKFPMLMAASQVLGPLVGSASSWNPATAKRCRPFSSSLAAWATVPTPVLYSLI